MARYSNGIGNMDEVNFNNAFDHFPLMSQMDLETAIKECSMALSLFMNDRFSDALDIMRPWAKHSMYHAVGYSSILTMQAGLTFEHKDIQVAMVALDEALHTCQRFRRRHSVVEMITHFFSGQGAHQLTEEEMHAEVCYAETLLHKAALSFVEDDSIITFLKAGIKIKKSYDIFKECQRLQSDTQDKANSETFTHFKGSINMGIGSFNLMLSLFPGKVLRLLEFIGFSGSKEVGLSQLRQGAASQSLRAIPCAITLLMYNMYVSVILGTGECNLVEVEGLLEPYKNKFPNGSLILFYVARIAVLKGKFELARVKFQECITSQQEWKQIHHLCYWELMWVHCFQQEWMEAYRYADLLCDHKLFLYKEQAITDTDSLCTENSWSQAVYMFQKAAVLSMLSQEQLHRTAENVDDLFRQVDVLQMRMAGKSIPSEKFAVRKARRYHSSCPVKLVLPVLEMMYVWNGFTIVGKRADLMEGLLITIEGAEEKLRNDRNPSEYHVDDQCLVQMLKGICLKHLGRLLQAELCFTQVISSEKRIKYDQYLVPFSLYELGLLYKLQGDFPRAITFIENAKANYNHYSLESRLHFRIQAALDSMAAPLVATP